MFNAFRYIAMPIDCVIVFDKIWIWLAKAIHAFQFRSMRLLHKFPGILLRLYYLIASVMFEVLSLLDIS